MAPDYYEKAFAGQRMVLRKRKRLEHMQMNCTHKVTLNTNLDMEEKPVWIRDAQNRVEIKSLSER